MTDDQKTCKRPDQHELLGAYELGLLPDEQRRDLEAHLVECEACFHELYDMDPVIALAKRGVGVPKEEIPIEVLPQTVARHRRTFVLSGLAVAAVIAIVAVLYGPWRFGEREVLRGREHGSILVYAPEGTSPPPERLEWAPVANAASYQIRLQSEDGDIIWRAAVPEPPAELPAETRSALRPGQTYLWQVEAVLDGGVRLQSAVVRFTVEGR